MNTPNNFDIVIERGTLFDGSGAPPSAVDIGVSGGKIVALCDLKNARATDRIDASGLYVCPGFIDAHCHTDTLAAKYPGAEGKMLQGVTTDVCGLCGGSEAPIGPGAAELRGRKAAATGSAARAITFAQYAQTINKQGNTTNMAMFVGNANLRAHAIGYENRAASADDLGVMRTMLRRAMEEGAYGLSTGLTYVPSGFASTEELVDLCKIIAPFGGIYNSHMRNEGDRVVESVEEVIRIAEASGCRGHISHLKAAGRRNFGKSEQCLRLIEDANRNGIDILFDVYPYTAGSINLSALLPAWVVSQGYGEDFSLLKSGDARQKIAADLRRDDWDNIILLCGYESIFIGDANGCHEYEGKNIAEIAGALGVSEFEAFLKVLIDSQAAATIVYHAMSEDDLAAFMRSPYCAIGTDAYARHYSGPSASGKPHPRNYGAFPRFIREFVIDRKLFSMQEGIHRITGLPAAMFGLGGRGLVKEGNIADLTVFDPETIRENGDYARPNVKPSGIEHVIIDGKPAVRNGRFMDIRAGRMLTRA